MEVEVKSGGGGRDGGGRGGRKRWGRGEGVYIIADLLWIVCLNLINDWEIKAKGIGQEVSGRGAEVKGGRSAKTHKMGRVGGANFEVITYNWLEKTAFT